jgi:riboflavin kinase/FMN adenylyltransferase
MQRLDSIDHADLRGAFLAIGSFDGMHRGHRHLLENMISSAREEGAPAVGLTFFPHPRTVLNPESGPVYYLSTVEERLALMEQIGLDAAILQPFDPAFAQISAADFLRKLKDRLRMRSIWCGPSFALGRGREGTIAYLSEQGLSLGFSLYVVPPLEDSEGPISSSQIRQALAAGDPRRAALLLGRPYALSGTVVHGAGRGRSMDTPTANLDLWREIMVPARGVYATWVEVGGTRRPSVTNIGLRPTFENAKAHEAIVETHILDFNGDLYGSRLKIEFAARLREERRFTGMDALHRQIAEDILQARSALGEVS